MIFRYARHTNDLAPIISFYTNVIGLEVIGKFENHSEYNGVFLGFKNKDWHLEFTQSLSNVDHYPDEDDLLVFYVNTELVLNEIVNDAKNIGAEIRKSKNPYWQKNGIEIIDPDGFGVIISVKDITLDANVTSNKPIKQKGIKTWNNLLKFIKELPYGRNASRTDLSLVLKEMKGTCSSKHAYLKNVALDNNLDQVKLILGIYKMNASNTPGIGNHIKENKLPYIPEAHCYLKINGKFIDVTNRESDIRRIKNDILQEIEIKPSQIGTFKVDYHKSYLKNWISENSIKLSFEKVWGIREKCIENLSC